jgi:hypothetical protein
MTDTVRIFIDEQPVEAPVGASIRSVLAARDPGLTAALDAGQAFVTDGVGRRISPETTASHGAIYRIVRSARRSPSGS